MKISVVFGTRPEGIKLAPVILALRKDPRFSIHVCVTAQHRHMLDQVLQAFDIVPDADLDLMRAGQTLEDLTCSALTSVSEYLKVQRPDLVLVQGDTTTVLATSLAAFYQNVAIGHLEAGLRTGNLKSPWPEEANRVLTSHLTTLHMAPTEGAKANLLAEGIRSDRIFVTGNTVVDALFIAVEKVRRSSPEILGLDPYLMNGGRDLPLVLITGHRRESFGKGLQSICEAIARLAQTFPTTQFVYPVHLNPEVRSTAARVLGSATAAENHSKNVHLIEPLPYLRFVALMDRATLILTDSGGIQEEAPSLGKPVLVTREVTERPEAVALGNAKLVGSDTEKIVREVSKVLTDKSCYSAMAQVRYPYGDGHATERILTVISNYFGIAQN
jgi:UDP-N-acetylglucosamine 2-epimerase (non-hydrolysing)